MAKKWVAVTGALILVVMLGITGCTADDNSTAPNPQHSGQNHQSGGCH